MTLRVPAELIDAARRGGTAEIASLLEAIWPEAYRLAKAILQEEAAAQDAAQDACIVIYRSITSLRNTGAFATWFYRIVTREAFKQKQLLKSTEATGSEFAYQDDRDAIADLWRALGTLSMHHRSVVVLHYLEGLTSREIAAVLRVPDATVRFRLMIARRRLRQALQETDSPASTKDEELYAL